MVTTAKTKQPVRNTKPAAKKAHVTEEDIRRKAQEIYEQRVKMGLPGDSQSDWLQAESQLRRR